MKKLPEQSSWAEPPLLFPANPNQHCPQWMNKGNCRKGAKCGFGHDPNRRESNLAISSSTTIDPAVIQAAPATTNGKGKGKGKDKGGAPPNKGGGRGRIRLTLDLALSSPWGNALRLTSVPLFIGSLRPKRGLSVMNGHGRKRPWQRVVETLLALLPRTLMLPVLPTSKATGKREPSATFITSTLVSVRL